MALINELDALRVLLSCIKADGKQRSDVFIEEKDKVAKLKKLHLSELKDDMLLLAVDEGRKIKDKNNKIMEICMSPLFSKESHSQNSACDAVLIRKKADGVAVYYIDLKSDAPSGFEKQFKSTQCFIHYLICLIKSIFEIETKIVKEKFIIFHTDSHNKVRFGPKPKTQFSPQDKDRQNSPKYPLKFCVRNEDKVRCTQFL